MFSVRAWFAAKRLGLRDRGNVETDDRDYYKIHAFCNTRLRIGVDKAGQSVRYCWRCEHVTGNVNDKPEPVNVTQPVITEPTSTTTVSEEPKVIDEPVVVDGLADVPDVQIDSEGGRKYVLLRVCNGNICNGNTSKLVVRSDQNADWHREIVAATKRQFPHLSITCPGGGYINVDPTNKRIRLSRQSGDYGRADHKVSAAIIKKTLPDFEIVTD